jgi:tetratricopeptide (TPR) repeat protein
MLMANHQPNRVLDCEELAVAHRDEMIDGYRQAVKQKPTDTEALLNLGDACRRRGQLPLAAETYRQAVALNPNDARAHMALAEALRDLGQNAEAAEVYEQALTVVRARMRPQDRGLTSDQIDVHALTRALQQDILQA